MQQLEHVEPGRLEWREVREPKLAGSLEALVRPIAVARCDLDTLMYSGGAPSVTPTPCAFGHECVAEVLEVGEAVRDLEPGDRVAVSFEIACGQCDPCRRGWTSACSTAGPHAMYGFGPNGGTDWGGVLADVVLPVLLGLRRLCGLLAVLALMAGTPLRGSAAITQTIDASGDGAGNTLDAPSSIAVDSAGHDPDRALAGDHLKYQDMGTGPAVLSIKATRELPGKTLDTGHLQACHHLPEVVRAIEDGRLHLGRVTSRIAPWENAIEAMVIPVRGEELISRRVDSAPEGRG